MSFTIGKNLKSIVRSIVIGEFLKVTHNLLRRILLDDVIVYFLKYFFVGRVIF